MEDPLPPPPEEFVCPISGLLMADPVITPSGYTFERGCILACLDLGYTPSSLSSSFDLSSFINSSSLTLIPNINLKTAILNWCTNSHFPKPFPFTREAAREILRGLIMRENVSSPKPVFIEHNTHRKSEPIMDMDRFLSYELEKPSKIEPVMNRYSKSESRKLSSPLSPSSFREITLVFDTPVMNRFMISESGKLSSLLSPSSFGEITPISDSPKTAPAATTDDSFEDSLLIKMIDTEPPEQEAALISLREATRENQDRRRSLCTSRMLGVLRRLLLSKNAGVQINAAASLVNLSLEASNKVNIVRAETVPPLVELLINESSELRDLAAGAIYSLAVEEKNRVAIGVLGAIPPLMQLFSTSSEGMRARRDAGMGLYYLTLEELNQSKFLRVTDITSILLEAVTQREIRRPSLMVLANIAECKEGREGFIDGGAMEILVGLMRDGEVAPRSAEEEHCLRALRGMSKASVRFRGMARMAGAEPVLRRVEESSGGARKEYAGRILRVMCGEEDEEISSSESMYAGGGADNGGRGSNMSDVSEMAGGGGWRYDYRVSLRKSANF
ncbi:hypothetical protein LUZ60_000289 [Juncus effusus]|nr:hypothetical protein LUZ60_000289 [Juncus effusus]